MRIAVATQDMARIDAHLGWARHLMIYEVSVEGYRYLRTASFRQGLGADGDGGKLSARLRGLGRCELVFVAAVGPAGETALARRRITPSCRFAGRPIAEALDALCGALRSGYGSSSLRQR